MPSYEFQNKWCHITKDFTVYLSNTYPSNDDILSNRTITFKDCIVKFNYWQSRTNYNKFFSIDTININTILDKNAKYISGSNDIVNNINGQYKYFYTTIDQIENNYKIITPKSNINSNKTITEYITNTDIRCLTKNEDFIFEFSGTTIPSGSKISIIESDLYSGISTSGGYFEFKQIFQINGRTESNLYVTIDAIARAMSLSSESVTIDKTNKINEIKNATNIKGEKTYYTYAKQYITTSNCGVYDNYKSRGGIKGELIDRIATLNAYTVFDGYKLSSPNDNIIKIVDIYEASNDGREYTEKYVYADDCREASENDLQEHLSENGLIEASSFLTEQNNNSILNGDFVVKDVPDVEATNEWLTQYSSAFEALSEDDNITTKSIYAVYGAPAQFLPLTDPRLPNNNEETFNIINEKGLGRTYADKIFKNMPFLFITPGVPEFLADYSQNQIEAFLTSLFSGGERDPQLVALVNNHGGRYYSLKFEYNLYFDYLNAMLHSATALLGIEKEKINGIELGMYNWQENTQEVLDTDRDGNGVGAGILSSLAAGTTDLLSNAYNSIKYMFTGVDEEITSTYGGKKGTIMFYADCGNQTDDSFSNSTTQSQLLSSLNSLSDLGRELTFLTGIADSNGAGQLNKLLDGGLNSLDNINDTINNALGKGNLLTRIVSKATTVLSGGRLLFPEIWSDSSFSRSYSFKMKLISNSGDKLSVFLNILVPIYHILALTLPRQSKASGAQEGYISPFLVRAYCQSLFNIDMGIITDLSITKGAEGEWTIDGLPTVAEINFTIKDLYDGLSMTQRGLTPLDGILSNTAELDYIANSCGVNINEQHTNKLLHLAKILYVNRFTSWENFEAGIRSDLINVNSSIQQWEDNRLKKIAGGFFRRF